jgi:1-acyl-sn-glycerol-3-phosphate acyltransferase
MRRTADSRSLLSRLLRDLPQFDPENDKLDLDFVERIAPYTEALSFYFRPTFHGLENIPAEGPAMLVGNHGLFAFDGFFMGIGVYRHTGRLVRGLGEHLLFVVPGIREFWERIGALNGTQENAINFLKAGHLVNTYPGGARDALKDRDALYKLHWDKSFGFVQVALRAQAPIILCMGIGIDDSYRILGKMRWTGRVMGHRKYDVPLLLGLGPLPLPVKFTYYFSEPIHLEGTPADADDPEKVRQLHQMLWDRGHEMLRDGLARRRSIWLG